LSQIGNKKKIHKNTQKPGTYSVIHPQTAIYDCATCMRDRAQLWYGIR